MRTTPIFQIGQPEYYLSSGGAGHRVMKPAHIAYNSEGPATSKGRAALASGVEDRGRNFDRVSTVSQLWMMKPRRSRPGKDGEARAAPVRRPCSLLSPLRVPSGPKRNDRPCCARASERSGIRTRTENVLFPSRCHHIPLARNVPPLHSTYRHGIL